MSYPEQPYKIASITGADVVPIDSLTPWPSNPRRGRIKLIRESLLANGQYRPIVVWTQGNVVLAGNHTMKAASELGGTHIARTLVDCDRATAARIVAVDNKASDLAEYDTGELVMLLEEVKKSSKSLEGTGFVQADFDLLNAVGGTPGTAAWKGMPEFKQPDATGKDAIVVHFVGPGDRERFAEVIGRPSITPSTRAIWYPVEENVDRSTIRYASGEISEQLLPPETDVPQAELAPLAREEAPF